VSQAAASESFIKALAFKNLFCLALLPVLGLIYPGLLGDLIEVIGRRLVDVVVDPVAVKVIAVRPPLQKRALGGIVVREIVERNIDVQTLADVTVILIAQGVAVILRMAHDKEASAVTGHAEQYARLGGFRQDLEILAGVDGLCGDLCIAAVGNQEIVVETADNGLFSVTHFM
jgi:hypothetical protein